MNFEEENRSAHTAFQQATPSVALGCSRHQLIAENKQDGDFTFAPESVKEREIQGFVASRKHCFICILCGGEA